MSRRLWTLLSAAALAAAPTFSAQSAVQTLEVEPVCFAVTNPADTSRQVLYGVRYRSGPMDASAPLILLVHGNADPTYSWDLTPETSAAKAIAGLGYPVMTVHRLGFGRSPYPEGPRDYTLTLSAHVAMLHDVVAAISSGNYRLAVHDRCDGELGPGTGVASERVVLIGQSSGGQLVAAYGAIFGDVAGVISLAGPLTPYMFTSSGLGRAGMTVASQAATGRTRVTPFPNRDECEALLLYLPGVDEGVRATACGSEIDQTAPIGEDMGVPIVFLAGPALMAAFPAEIPVLLAWADHDALVPTDVQAAETLMWKRLCRCDVTAWTQEDAGHGAQFHKSFPTLVDRVGRWLGSHGLGLPHAARRGRAQRSQGSPGLVGQEVEDLFAGHSERACSVGAG